MNEIRRIFISHFTDFVVIISESLLHLSTMVLKNGSFPLCLEILEDEF